MNPPNPNIIPFVVTRFLLHELPSIQLLLKKKMDQWNKLQNYSFY